jgi:hypothetical protein
VVSSSSSTASGATSFFDLLNLGIGTKLNIQACGNRRHDLCQLRQLVLGEQIDLQIEIGAFICRGRCAVLAYQDECRQEGRFNA